jgi:hypothetical protein
MLRLQPCDEGQYIQRDMAELAHVEHLSPRIRRDWLDALGFKGAG